MLSWAKTHFKELISGQFTQARPHLSHEYNYAGSAYADQ